MTKPTFTLLETPGLHNLDSLAAGRILEGASWKVQRIVVVMPAGPDIPTKVALALWCLIFPPNNGVVRIACEGMEVGDAYSSAIEGILAHPEFGKWEYILTVEHDNLPPSDGVIRLVESMDKHPELSCIGGLYWTKGEGGVPQIWGDPKDPVLNFRPQPPEPETVQECCGTGMGFNLWRTSMFRDEKLRRPWFKTIAGAEGCGTQDLHFWSDARKHGYRCAIDTRVKVGHFDKGTGIVW